LLDDIDKFHRETVCDKSKTIPLKHSIANRLKREKPPPEQLEVGFSESKGSTLKKVLHTPINSVCHSFVTLLTVILARFLKKCKPEGHFAGIFDHEQKESTICMPREHLSVPSRGSNF
jgi:hypothetical protein